MKIAELVLQSGLNCGKRHSQIEFIRKMNAEEVSLVMVSSQEEADRLQAIYPDIKFQFHNPESLSGFHKPVLPMPMNEAEYLEIFPAESSSRLIEILKLQHRATKL